MKSIYGCWLLAHRNEIVICWCELIHHSMRREA